VTPGRAPGVCFSVNGLDAILGNDVAGDVEQAQPAGRRLRFFLTIK